MNITRYLQQIIISIDQADNYQHRSKEPYTFLDKDAQHADAYD
jgi:hypothetical protein